MSRRLEVFETALNKCQELRTKYPDLDALRSIELQLTYLNDLASGVHSDRSRLKDINIGVLTAREIEPLDEDTAEVFYQAAGEARQM